LGTLTPKSWLRADELHPAKLPYHTIAMSKSLYRLANSQAELVIKELLNRRIEISGGLMTGGTGNSGGVGPGLRGVGSNSGPVRDSSVYFGHMIASVVSVLFNDNVIGYFRCVNPVMPSCSTWILLTEDLTGSVNPHNAPEAEVEKIEKIEGVYNRVILTYGNLLDHFEAWVSYVHQNGFMAVVKPLIECRGIPEIAEYWNADDPSGVGGEHLIDPKEKWCCVAIKQVGESEDLSGNIGNNWLLIALFDEFRRYRGVLSKK